MEPMDIQQAVEHFKTVKEGTPCTMPLVLYLERDGKFLANIISPWTLPDSRLATSMMLACLAAFNADKAIFVCEVNAQHVDTADGVDPMEDPNARPAVLVFQGDRGGETQWMLSPYGLGDSGQIEWIEGEALKSTLTGPISTLIASAWGMGDRHAEVMEVVALLHANEYQMVINRAMLEGK